MTEIERILDQIERAYQGKAWCGSSLIQVIADVTAERAAFKPIPNARSIWEIVLHMAAAKEEVRLHLAGKEFVNPYDESFLPEADNSTAAWKRALKLLAERHDVLRKAVASLDESRLDQPIADGRTSVYVTLHGCVQHDLYHAAQIGLLKKIQR